ncbi:MAG: hypothetical protein JNK87_32810 [Bryobacterales bacterium]|nr:hypothetical protein [Bryobacterales bacterium]
MPSVPTYPKSHAVIKASKRNYNAVLAAVQAVNQTKAAVIATMGGILVVAGAIWSAISSLVGQTCTIFSVMMKMMQMMQMEIMQAGTTVMQTDAIYAVMVKLV